MGMTVEEELANTWVIYWPPAGPGINGQETPGEPQALKANWKTGQMRSITADGETFSVTETVMTSREIKPGGFLKRVEDMLSASASSVLAAHTTDDVPRDSQIRGVNLQNFFDDTSDKVYSASL